MLIYRGFGKKLITSLIHPRLAAIADTITFDLLVEHSHLKP
jgi:hypothetical protein